MVGLERSILPAFAEQEFHIATRTAIPSFIANWRIGGGGTCAVSLNLQIGAVLANIAPAKQCG
jgi:hypothetical protein